MTKIDIFLGKSASYATFPYILIDFYIKIYNYSYNFL